jgi:hypothetical protein
MSIYKENNSSHKANAGLSLLLIEFLFFACGGSEIYLVGLFLLCWFLSLDC